MSHEVKKRGEILGALEFVRGMVFSFTHVSEEKIDSHCTILNDMINSIHEDIRLSLIEKD
jgi:hypothetical protein